MSGCPLCLLGGFAPKLSNYLGQWQQFYLTAQTLNVRICMDGLLIGVLGS
jgi:hypothetical protein